MRETMRKSRWPSATLRGVCQPLEGSIGGRSAMDTHDLAAFEGAMERALGHLRAANEALAPYLALLTKEQRKHLVRTPLRFPKAALETVQASRDFPELLAASPKFSPEQVLARLEAVKLLAGLSNQAQAIAQKVHDTYRAWMSQAYLSTLSL